MRSPVMSACCNSSAAVPVRTGEMGSKAYLGGEGVRYRIGARSAPLLNEEGMARPLVDYWKDALLDGRPWWRRPLRAIAMQLYFAEGRTTLNSRPHEANIKLVCKASALAGIWWSWVCGEWMGGGVGVF